MYSLRTHTKYRDIRGIHNVQTFLSLLPFKDYFSPFTRKEPSALNKFPSIRTSSLVYTLPVSFRQVRKGNKNLPLLPITQSLQRSPPSYNVKNNSDS